MTPVGKNLGAVLRVLLLWPCLALGCSRVRDVQQFCTAYAAQCGELQAGQIQEAGEPEHFSWKSQTPNLFFAGDDMVIINADGVSDNSLHELLSTIMTGDEKKTKLSTLTSLLKILVSFFDDIDAEFTQGAHNDFGDDCDRFISLWSNVRDEYHKQMVPVPHDTKQQQSVSRKPVFPGTIFVEKHPSTSVSSKPSNIKPIVDYSIPKKFYSILQKPEPEDFSKGTRRPNIQSVEQQQKPSMTSTAWIQTEPVRETVHQSSKPISFVVERKYPPTVKYPRPSFAPLKIDSKKPQTFTTIKDRRPTPTTSMQKFTINFEKSEPSGVFDLQGNQIQRPHISKTTPPKVSDFKVPASKPSDNYYSKPKFEITLGSKFTPTRNTSKPLSVIHDQYKPGVVKRPQNFNRPELNFSVGRKPTSNGQPVRPELHPEVVVEVVEIPGPKEGTTKHTQEKPTFSFPERNHATEHGVHKIELPFRDTQIKYFDYPDVSRFLTAIRPDSVKTAAPKEPSTGVPNFFSKFTLPSRNKVQYQSIITLPAPDKAGPEVLQHKPYSNTFPRPSALAGDDHKPAFNVRPTHGTSWTQALQPKVINYTSTPYKFITQNRDPQVIDFHISGSGTQADPSVPLQRPFVMREPWKDIPSDAGRFAGPYGLQKPQSPQKVSADQPGSILLQPTPDYRTRPNQYEQYEFPLIDHGPFTNTGDQGGSSGPKFNPVKGNIYPSGRHPGGLDANLLGQNERLGEYPNYAEFPILVKSQKFDGNSGHNFPDKIGGSFDLPSNNVLFSSGSSSIPVPNIDYFDDYRGRPQLVPKQGLLNNFGSLAYDYRNPSVEEHVVSDSVIYENYDTIGLSELGASFVGHEDDSLPSYLVTDYLAELEYNYNGYDQNNYYGQDYINIPESLAHTYDQLPVLSSAGGMEEFSNVDAAGISYLNDPGLAPLYEYNPSYDDYLSYVSDYRSNSPAFVDGSSLEGASVPVSYIDSLPQINIGTDFNGGVGEQNYQKLFLGNPNLSNDFYTEYGDNTNYRDVDSFPSQFDAPNQLPVITVWDDADPIQQPMRLQNVPSVEYSGADVSFYGYEEIYDDLSSPLGVQGESQYAEEYSLMDIFPSKQEGFMSNYKSQNLQRSLGSSNFEYGVLESDQLISDYLQDRSYVYDDLQSSGSKNAENSGGTFSSYPLRDQNAWSGLSNYPDYGSLNRRADQGEVSSHQFSGDTSTQQAGIRFENYLDTYDTQVRADSLLELDSYSNADYIEAPTGARYSHGDQFGTAYEDFNYELSYSSYDGQSSNFNPSYDLGLVADPERAEPFDRSLSRVSREIGTQNNLGLCTIQSSGCELYCDGFWVVIQDRNRETSRTFDRSLHDYSIGFGDIYTGYWMGLECLHHLTADRPHQLLVEVTDESGRVASSLYESFSVDEYFQLHLGRFVKGGAGDGLRGSNGALFSTFDQDLDYSLDNCAARLGGGWWYRDCHQYGSDSFLNGDFFSADGGGSGVQWGPWSTSAPVVSTRMLIKPSLFLPLGYDEQYPY